MIRLSLPLGPSVNHIYARNRGGYQLRLTDAARAYHLLVNRAVADLDLPPDFRLRAPLKVTAQLTVTTRRRYDIDNSAKLLLDCLADALGFDDNWITDLRMTKTLELGGQARCEVTVEEIAKGGKS